MYYTDDSLMPENMDPLIICAAPYGPAWLPGDAPDLPVSFEAQTQSAVDCYNAGATMLHVHVRDPKTGHGSTDMDDFCEMLGRLRKAVPKMILSVGGSISFAPKGPGQTASGSATTPGTCSPNLSPSRIKSRCRSARARLMSRRC
jgi:uncharacterized protein (DUF849 family)